MEQLKRVFAHLGRYKKEFILAVLFVVLETGLEMFIPVIMADTIDVGVANRDVNYILIKGVQMGVCALLSLVTGMLYARTWPGQPVASARFCVRSSTKKSRSIPSRIWTGSRPHR